VTKSNEGRKNPITDERLFGTREERRNPFGAKGSPRGKRKSDGVWGGEAAANKRRHLKKRAVDTWAVKTGRKKKRRSPTT